MGWADRFLKYADEFVDKAVPDSVAQKFAPVIIPALTKAMGPDSKNPSLCLFLGCATVNFPICAHLPQLSPPQEDFLLITCSDQGAQYPTRDP